MKTSTLVVLGLGAAAVLFLVLKPGAVAGSHAGSSIVNPQPTARNSRQALERAAVNVGEKLANKAVDWFFDDSDRTSVADSLSV